MQAIEGYLAKIDSMAEGAVIFVDPLAVVQDLKNICLNEISENELGELLSTIYEKRAKVFASDGED